MTVPTPEPYGGCVWPLDISCDTGHLGRVRPGGAGTRRRAGLGDAAPAHRRPGRRLPGHRPPLRPVDGMEPRAGRLLPGPRLLARQLRRRMAQRLLLPVRPARGPPGAADRSRRRGEARRDRRRPVRVRRLRGPAAFHWKHRVPRHPGHQPARHRTGHLLRHLPQRPPRRLLRRGHRRPAGHRVRQSLHRRQVQAARRGHHHHPAGDQHGDRRRRRSPAGRPGSGRSTPTWRCGTPPTSAAPSCGAPT